MSPNVRRYIKEHHALYLLFWPFNLAAFFLTEKFALFDRVLIHSPIDDLIPFSEYFMAIYVLWYPFWVFTALYCFICEPETFRRLMWFFILTFTVCNLTYFFFPTCVDFQPTSFEHNNFFTLLTRLIYWLDEPTNVLPSEHVIGAMAVVFAAYDSKRLRRARWFVPILVLAVLISISILFTKQHSFWDLVSALPLCALGWAVCFKPWDRDKTENAPSSPQTS